MTEDYDRYWSGLGLAMSVYSPEGADFDSLASRIMDIHCRGKVSRSVVISFVLSRK